MKPNMTTLSLRNLINRSPLRSGVLLTGMALSFSLLALSPQARALCQEGCIGTENTVLGDDALFALTTGAFNTAIGSEALFHNTTGNDNTASGLDALISNTTGNDNTANGSEALFSNTTGVDNTASGR